VVTFVYSASAVGGETGDLLETLRRRGDELAADALEQARTAGVNARAELVNDRPADALAQVAAEEGAQLIAVGSYGEAPLKAVFLGSTPHRLLHLTETPVLVVRGRKP
jgi:nucleotide-binding universal stress UspA family protein